MEERQIIEFIRDEIKQLEKRKKEVKKEDRDFRLILEMMKYYDAQKEALLNVLEEIDGQLQTFYYEGAKHYIFWDEVEKDPEKYEETIKRYDAYKEGMKKL